MIDTLRRGLEDEMNSARKYVALAAKCEDLVLQTEFMSYAADELEHARKLMDFLGKLDAEAGPLDLREQKLDEDPDFFAILVEYIAEEESAVFYYEALEKLATDEAMKRTAREIEEEEKLHYQKIKGIFNRLKERAGKGSGENSDRTGEGV